MGPDGTALLKQDTESPVKSKSTDQYQRLHEPKWAEYKFKTGWSGLVV